MAGARPTGASQRPLGAAQSQRGRERRGPAPMSSSMAASATSEGRIVTFGTHYCSVFTSPIGIFDQLCPRVFSGG